MNARHRASKPIDIALTEEQLEGIIAEAAARTGQPSANPGHGSTSGVTWTTSGDRPLPGSVRAAPGLVSGAPVYVPLADVPLPSHAFLPGIVSPGTISPVVITDDEPGAPEADGIRESLEVAEHRRNVIRQLRGR